MTEREMRICNYVRVNGPCSVRRITDALHIQPFQAVNTACNKLSKSGQLIKDDSQCPHRYSVLTVPNPRTNTPPCQASSLTTSNIDRRSKPHKFTSTTIAKLKKAIEGKRVLYIIPCCGRKRAGGVNQIAPGGVVIPNLLPLSLSQQLYESRQRVRNQWCANVHHGSDFGVANPVEADYLPAYERYDGDLYRVPGVREILAQCHTKVLIMSALYGLLSPQELIQWYNLRMGNPRAIGYLWAEALPPIIDACAASLKAEIIVGLFAKAETQASYSYVFGQLANNAGISAYMVHVEVPLRVFNATYVSRGLGLMLLHLVQGAANEFNYDVVNVRP